MKYTATVNGKTYEVEVERADSPHKPIPRGVYTGEMPAPAPAAPVAAAPAAAAPAPAAAPAAGGTEVRSPMPGNILNILVSEGQAVTAGQVLVMLEAMKMENEIVAPAAGTVKQIPVAKGAAVDTDALLVVLG